MRILIYSVVAVVLGLLLTLIPSVIVGTEKTSTIGRFLFGGVEESENNYVLDVPKYSVGGFEIFVVSFIIASVAYVLVKWKMSH